MPRTEPFSRPGRHVAHVETTEPPTDDGRTDAVSGVAFGPAPTEEAIRRAVRRLKRQGLCGRRIGEQRLGPYFIASPEHGERELALLEDVLADEYEGSSLCLETRQSECSRLRGGCRQFRA